VLNLSALITFILYIYHGRLIYKALKSWFIDLLINAVIHSLSEGISVAIISIISILHHT